jgi:acetylornithine aminotransferase
MLGKSALGTAFTYGSHGTTFGGNKLVLSSSKAVLEILTEDFLAKVRVKASYLQDQLAKQLGNLPTVVAIRGLGLILGIQVTGDLGTIVTQARKNGLIVLTAGSDVIRLLPPLTITEEEIERAVSILAECLS